LHRFILLAFLFFLSGFASLTDEVIFSRLLTFSFGVSIYATSAVTAAFLAGLGLGAYALSSPSRWTKRPILIYGVLELAIGVMVPLFPTVAKALTPALASLFSGIEPESFSFASARFVSAFAILVAPSFLMGGTLPFMIRAAVPEDSANNASGVGFYYAVNTFGAGLGALMAGYIFLPSLGYGGAILLSSAISIIVGLVAITMGLKENIPVGAIDASNPDVIVFPFPANNVERPKSRTSWLVFAAVFIGGLISLSQEIIWTRILINLFGGSVYAFALTLTVFLCGLALGSWILPGLLCKMRRPLSGLAFLLTLCIGATAVGMMIFRIRTGLSGPLGGANNLFPTEGSTFVRTYLQYAAIAGIAILPPAFFFGGILPFASGVFSGKGVLSQFTGRLYAISSAGSITGALLAGFVLLPFFTAEGGLVFGALLALVMASLLFFHPTDRKNLKFKPAVFALTCSTILLVISVVYHPADNMKYETLFFKEGPAATVKVETFIDNGKSINSLRVNGKVVATSGFLDQRLQFLLGHISALCHPKPDKILSVGLGTGMSSGALAEHDPSSFEIVELSKT